MSISSYISLIRSASSAYEMRSEMVGAFLEINNIFYSKYSIDLPSPSSFAPCTALDSENYWGLVYNGDNLSFPLAVSLPNVYVLGSKTASIIDSFNALDDGYSAYSIFNFNFSGITTTIYSVGEYEFLNSQSPSAVIVSIHKDGDWLKSIFERTVTDLWNTSAPVPSVAYMYAGCKDLISAFFYDLYSAIASYAFYDCVNLNSVNFPNCTGIMSYAFANCSNLTRASFSKCSFIRGGAFKNCTNLTELYLLSNMIVSLPDSFGSAFHNTHFFNIYVPASLYSCYLTNEVWSYQSTMLRSFS